MKNRHLDFATYKKRALEDRELRLEYDKLQPEFALIETVLQARKKQGLTQEALAKKVGTKQSVISRLEIGDANPSVAFLKRLAHALNRRLEIRFTSL